MKTDPKEKRVPIKWVVFTVGMIGFCTLCFISVYLFGSFMSLMASTTDYISTSVPSQPTRSGTSIPSRPTRGSTSSDAGYYVDLVDWDWKLSSSGDYVEVSGTVKNTHPSKPICFVRIRSRLQDRQGNDLNADWTYADSGTIRPNSSSPFSLFYKYVEGADTIHVAIESASFDLCN